MFLFHLPHDLIETLWNVKACSLYLPSLLLFDLIETLWNVKRCEKNVDGKAERRFNRDIVECKAGY